MAPHRLCLAVQQRNMFSPFTYIDFIYDSCVAAVVIKGCHLIDDILFILNTEISCIICLTLKLKCVITATSGTKQDCKASCKSANLPTANFIVNSMTVTSIVHTSEKSWIDPILKSNTIYYDNDAILRLKAQFTQK